jgi:hypothetical protein
MAAPDRTFELTLAFGLSDGRGRRARGATLSPINGRGELMGADHSNPFQAALLLLAASTAQLGPFRDDAVDPALLAGLLPVDRDLLIIGLLRLTFGDVRYQTVRCPAGGCGKRVDVRLDLSTVETPAGPAEAGGRLSLPDGRSLRYRLPTAGDQAALHGLPEAELEAAFLERCVVPEATDRVDALPAEVRAAVVREVLAASPALDLTLDLECVECGKPFRFTYAPVAALLDELRATRGELLREIHYLAYHYHWSQAEILALTRELRHEYLSLLREELTRSAGALA